MDIPITTGEPLRKVAFAAINTALSVAALANLLIEFPVIGAITIQSSGLLGPNGSASCIEEITFSPAIPSIFSIHSAPVPKRVAACSTDGVIIGITCAPAFFKSSILGTTSA